MKDRKEDHLRICVQEEVEVGDPGFEELSLIHRAAPELDLESVNTEVKFLGKKLKHPLIFEAITGGTKEAGKINKTLAKVAQKYGLGMGVGSQRAAIEDPKLAGTYSVRDVAPDILLIGNVGAVQLNKGYAVNECEKAVEMIGADVLAFHFNPLQEAVQPEGDTQFSNLCGKVNKVARDLSVKTLAKEVGCGLDCESASLLEVDALDCAGAGGTSWSLVESYRSESAMGEVGVTFSDWGIPTAECVRQLVPLGKPLIASGGVRSGLDAAKCVALGADCVGVALPILKAYYLGGEEAVESFVHQFTLEFKSAMYLTGSENVSELRGKLR